jgi:hypothetical protein
MKVRKTMIDLIKETKVIIMESNLRILLTSKSKSRTIWMNKCHQFKQRPSRDQDLLQRMTRIGQKAN